MDILKNFVVKEIEESLKKGDFRHVQYSGSCFDFAVKTSELIFVKALGNVDALRKEQAKRMSTLSSVSGAKVITVGQRTASSEIRYGEVVERYGIGVVNPETFSDMLMGEMPEVKRSKGGHYRVVDAEKLRKRRMEKGLTQQDLADILGVSKKTIYVHERGDRPAPASLVEQMEKVLGDVSKPIDMAPKPPGERAALINAGLFDAVIGGKMPVFAKETNRPKDIKYLVEFSARLEEKVAIATDIDIESLPEMKNYNLDMINRVESLSKLLWKE